MPEYSNWPSDRSFVCHGLLNCLLTLPADPTLATDITLLLPPLPYTCDCDAMEYIVTTWHTKIWSQHNTREHFVK